MAADDPYAALQADPYAALEQPRPPHEAEGPSIASPGVRRMYEHAGFSNALASNLPVVGPLAQKGIAAVNAGVGRLFGGNDTYEEHRRAQGEAEAEYQNEHPALAATGAVGGALAMGPARGALSGGTTAVATHVGTPLARSALGGGTNPLWRKVATGGATNAGIGAADTYARGDLANPDAGEIATGGALGGAAGMAVPLAGRAIGGVVNRFTGVTRGSRAPTREALGDAADVGYGGARNSGVELDPAGVQRIASQRWFDLHARGANPDPHSAPGTFAELRRLLQPQTGPNGHVFMDANDFERVRGGLQAIRANHLSNPTDRAAAGETIQALDEYLANPPHQDVIAGNPRDLSVPLEQGRGNAAAGYRVERANELQRNAEITAAQSNSGKNEAAKLRQGWGNTVKSERKSYGYSPGELEDAERIARGSWLGNRMRDISHFMGGGGGLGAAVTSGLGAGAGYLSSNENDRSHGAFWGGLAGLAGGQGARIAAERIVRRQMAALSDRIAMRSPLGQRAQVWRERGRRNINNTTNAIVGAGGGPALSNVFRELNQDDQ